MFRIKTYSITISNMYSNGLIGWVLAFAINFIDLIWQLVLLVPLFSNYDRFQWYDLFYHMVQVDVDFAVTIGIGGLTTILASGVNSKTL